MATVILVVLTLAMGIVLIRALKGPRVLNRILAVNTFGTTTVLWLATFAFVSGRHDVIDIATIYALTSFVATISVLKYVERGDLGADPLREPEADSGPEAER